MATQPESLPPNAFVDAALSYAARGWRVFPLAPYTKKPFRDTNGFKDAVSEDGQIRAWWSGSPLANIGIATGAGLIALDLDRYKEEFDEATVASWRLPPTLTAISARGGQHLLYHYPAALPCVAENGLAQGVCVKAAGGYIVAPPSMFQRQRYRFEDAAQPLADLPERIAEMIRAGGAVRVETTPPVARAAGRVPASDAQYWLDKALAKSDAGNGDTTGHWLAMMLFVNDVPDARGTLQTYADRATRDANDPFTDRDVARWIRSARESDIVRRGEPSRRVAVVANHAQNITQAITKTPHVREELAEEEKEEEDHANHEEAQEQPLPELEPDDVSDKDLLDFSADDEGNAQTMMRLYGRQFLYVPAYGWMQWVETHWRMAPPEIVVQYIIKALKRRRHAAVEQSAETIVKVTACSASRINGCMTIFRALVVEPDVGVFDRDPDELNCQNGVLHLKTGRVTPHTAQQRFTYCVPVDYDSRADMTAWETFILEAVGQDAQVARYLQACAGYSMTGHTRDEKVFYLYGPSRAGKGTYTETLMALLPMPLSTEVDFSTFTAPRDSDSQNFDLAALKPARVVIASESKRSQSLNPAKVKQLSGGNQIRCAFKHKDMFTYHPQFCMWLVSNHPVNADADDDALWGRLHVITFPHSHLGAEDRLMKARMRSPANLRGVLRWMVEGAQRWYHDGGLNAPGAIVEATEGQRNAQDYIKHWLDDRCDLRADGWTSSAELLTSYQNWCQASGLKPIRANELADTLVKRFRCQPERHGKDRMRGYRGVQVRATSETSGGWWTDK